MQIKAIAPLAAATLFLAACSSDAGHKQTAGTVLGGIGGAVIGSQIGSGSGQIVATALGTFAGALIGGDIGRSLDRADQLAMQQAEQRAHNARIGETIEWNNPDSGNYGAVTPLREGTHARSGAYCREYESTVTIEGREQFAYGTVCQQSDGSWEIVS
jgi:surface antigen